VGHREITDRDHHGELHGDGDGGGDVRPAHTQEGGAATIALPSHSFQYILREFLLHLWAPKYVTFC